MMRRLTGQVGRHGGVRGFPQPSSKAPEDCVSWWLMRAGTDVLAITVHERKAGDAFAVRVQATQRS